MSKLQHKIALTKEYGKRGLTILLNDEDKSRFHVYQDEESGEVELVLKQKHSKIRLPSGKVCRPKDGLLSVYALTVYPNGDTEVTMPEVFKDSGSAA